MRWVNPKIEQPKDGQRVLIAVCIKGDSGPVVEYYSCKYMERTEEFYGMDLDLIPLANISAWTPIPPYTGA